MTSSSGGATSVETEIINSLDETDNERDYNTEYPEEQDTQYIASEFATGLSNELARIKISFSDLDLKTAVWLNPLTQCLSSGEIDTLDEVYQPRNHINKYINEVIEELDEVDEPFINIANEDKDKDVKSIIAVDESLPGTLKTKKTILFGGKNLVKFLSVNFMFENI